MRRSLFRRSVLLVAVAVGMTVAWSVGRAQGQKDNAGTVLYVSAAKANFKSTNPGVSMAAIWGDAATGAHGTWTKFDPGYDAGMHTHTNDVWIAVVKGAYLYKDEAGEKRVAACDFIRVPGGHKHWSGGDKKEGALFYEESSGKFDFIAAK